MAFTSMLEIHGILAVMYLPRLRGRRWWMGAIAAVAIAGLAALILRPVLERLARARIESAALRHGMAAHVAQVHVGLWPLLRLEGVDIDARSGLRLHADAITATWPGRLRLHLRAASLAGPAGLTTSAPFTAWNVTGLRGNELRLTLVEPQSGLSIDKLATTTGNDWHIEARGLDVSQLLDIRRNGHPLLEGGFADGNADLHAGVDALRFHLALAARGARLGALSDSADDQPQLGDPTDVKLRFDGTWQPKAGVIEIPDLHATIAGADVAGTFAVHAPDTDPSVDLALGVRQLDFGELLGASGLDISDSLQLAPGSSRDLGSASINFRVSGRLADPESLSASQKISFRPPRRMPPAIARLRGDFVFRAGDGAGPHRPIDVSPASPDYIALTDVPPLFIRTLLMAEDAGFYGHRGIDLRELPTALLTDWSRGGAARGASTITQQLAKNLFLSRDKQLGRKLQELAITFLLESALGKERILEIYLNIIEWGPDLRGLRPASRHYFGREPKALTPAEMAFLVAIIPGPIKYQSSFAHGTPGPGLRALIDGLLAKLRSVDAIGEEEYQRAIAEPLLVASAPTG